MQAHALTHNHVYTHTSRVEVDVATTDVVGGGAVEPPQGLTLQLQDKSEDLAASFAVPQGDRGGEAGRASVFLPWSSFVKQIHWGCSNCQIDPASINGLAFYVLYQPGPFRVTLRRIAALGKGATFLRFWVALPQLEPGEWRERPALVCRLQPGDFDKGKGKKKFAAVAIFRRTDLQGGV